MDDAPFAQRMLQWPAPRALQARSGALLKQLGFFAGRGALNLVLVLDVACVCGHGIDDMATLRRCSVGGGGRGKARAAPEVSEQATPQSSHARIASAARPALMWHIPPEPGQTVVPRLRSTARPPRPPLYWCPTRPHPCCGAVSCCRGAHTRIATAESAETPQSARIGRQTACSPSR